MGTNGGGFFGPNSCHPFENPSDWTNVVECVCIILLPMACLVMFGIMIKNLRHAVVIYFVSLTMAGTFTCWAICQDSLKPNPALGSQHEWKLPISGGGDKVIPALAALPVDSLGLGNTEGKELRFGPSAGSLWAGLTTVTSNGSVNCMHDSLNPAAGLTPLTGMWLNCIFGGVGVGLINLLIYLVTAVFLSGLMVGRTPEYLGKKVEAREMMLAMLALLIHVRLRARGHDHPGRRAPVPAGRGAGTDRRALWSHPLWTMSSRPNRPPKADPKLRRQTERPMIIATTPEKSQRPADDLKMARRISRRQGLFAPDLLKAAAVKSIAMLRPDVLWKNPVMFVVEVGTVLSIAFTAYKIINPASTQATLGYLLALDCWLLLTVLFANFAESLAEARGKAQADSLRKTRRSTPAFRYAGRVDSPATLLNVTSTAFQEVASTDLHEGDLVSVEAGQFIPNDGEIVAGVASVDESAITGESAPVVREAGGDRSGVTGGTRVLSDRIIVRITAAAALAAKGRAAATTRRLPGGSPQVAGRRATTGLRRDRRRSLRRAGSRRLARRAEACTPARASGRASTETEATGELLRLNPGSTIGRRGRGQARASPSDQMA